MLIGQHLRERDGLADFHRGKLAVLVLAFIDRIGVGLGIAAFLVHGEKARVDHGGAAGAERGIAAGIEVDRHRVQRRVLHLAGDRALPDQIVELALVVIEEAGHAGRRMQRRGRADRLVRFLRVLGFGTVQMRVFGQRARAVVARDDLADFRDRVVGQAHRIGTHVGDQADRAFVAERDAFVQTLRDAHGAAGGEPQLARGLLLQRRGGEWRRGTALALLGLHLADDQPSLRGFDQAVARCMRVFFVGQVELLEFLAAQAGQARGEALHRVRAVGFDRPVFARLERFDFLFALADHAQRRRLHAPGRQAALHLAPQHRRQVEADQVIQRPTRLLRIDQVVRQLPRRGHGGLDRLGRDLGEHHPVQLLALGQATLVEDLADVPADRLAFAIQVGREIDVVGQLGGLGNRVDVFLVTLDHLVGHGETMLGIDRALLRPQVAHVAVGGQHLEVLAEVFVDRLGLGWRFDDEQVFCHETGFPQT